MQEWVPVSWIQGAGVMSDNSHQAEAATDRLCRHIKQLRQQRQWTLEQLSQASGVSRSMLSQIERQAVNPTFPVAYRISQRWACRSASWLT